MRPPIQGGPHKTPETSPSLPTALAFVRNGPENADTIRQDKLTRTADRLYPLYRDLTGLADMSDNDKNIICTSTPCSSPAIHSDHATR